jgi:pimeloyl-ACP methyl ester carboxylesterase
MADEAFKTKNVVLVHGAFADGSSWSGVVERLQAAGLHVVAVQNPLTSLTADVRATRRVLAMQDGSTVLVGHSYGGTVISEVGVDPKVTGLVYVAALAPEPGEDVSPTGELTKQFHMPPAGESISVTDDFAQFDEKGFIENFAPDVPPERARVLAASQGPIEQTLFDQKTTVAAWKEKPIWYAVSTMDRVIDPDLERFFAARMKAHTVQVAASHASPVSQPSAIAELIELAARGVP